MGDFQFGKDGRIKEPTPCKWYEVIGMAVPALVIGLLIGKFLLDKCL
jgi:hypothetical protein